MSIVDKHQRDTPSELVRAANEGRATAYGELNDGQATSTFQLSILPSDIDHMGHVNNAVYLNWVQDAVVRHWTSKASDKEVARHLWVAVKHEITYRRPAYLEDTIYATIRATAFQGAKAMFDTVIHRGDSILAEIKSMWCCLDTSTRRPMRIAQTIVQRFLVQHPVGDQFVDGR